MHIILYENVHQSCCCVLFDLQRHDFYHYLQHRVHQWAALLIAAHPVVWRVLHPRALEELPHGLIVVVDVLREGAEHGVGLVGGQARSDQA